MNGVLIKDLTKSSSTTAAIEFRPVDSELEERADFITEFSLSADDFTNVQRQNIGIESACIINTN